MEDALRLETVLTSADHINSLARLKGNAMSSRFIISIAAVTVLATVFISTEASAWRGGVRVGGAHGGVYRGGVYRGAYARRGVGVGLGAVAVGAAVAAPYGRPACGYYPYPPCY
jgi:hypothetical protein